MKLRTIVLILGTMLIMSYDPRTGITTFKDVPDATASDPVPSTATTPAAAPTAPAPAPSVFAQAAPAAPAAPSPYDRAAYDAFVNAGGNSGWALSHDMGPIEYLVANGIPLPPQVYDGILNWVNSNSGVGGVAPGSPDSALWNKFVAAVQDRESGGGHGFLGTGISTGNDSLDNALGYAQGAMWAGNVGGAALTGGDLGQAALSDALALGGATAAPAVSSALGGGMLGAVGGGAAGGLIGSLGSGDNDLLTGAATGALTAGALRGGGELYAGFTAPAAPTPSTATTLADFTAPSLDAYGDPLKRGMLPSSGLFDPIVLAQADTGTLTDVPMALADGSTPLMPPAVLDTGGQPMMPAAILDTGSASGFGGMLPAAVPETDPTFSGSLTETAPGVFAQPPASPATAPAETPEQREQRVQEATKTVEKLAKLTQTLTSMTGGSSTPQDAPTRTRTNDDGTQEQLSDADYSQSLAQYALPPQVSQELADAGLTPGTPEYYQAVMDRLDATIQQILGDTDPDAADLAQQLRGKSEEELIALERALFVRGQIGELMGSGTYIDPVTQKQEEVVAQGGTKVRPAVAAYHRGLARSADELAGMSPQEAKRYVGGMLSRDTDLYGMQARADAQAMAEALASQGYSPEEISEILKRRRGGMLPMAA